MWPVRLYTSVTQSTMIRVSKHGGQAKPCIITRGHIFLLQLLFIAQDMLLISQNIYSKYLLLISVVRSNVSCLRCISSVAVFVFGCECVYGVRGGNDQSFSPWKSSHLRRSVFAELTATVFTSAWLSLYFRSIASKGCGGASLYATMLTKTKDSYSSKHQPP